MYMETTNPINLKKEVDLRLFMFVAKKDLTESGVLISSYDLEKAMVKATDIVAKDSHLRFVGSLLMCDILDSVKTQVESKTEKTSNNGETNTTTDWSKDQWLNNLRLYTDNYVKSKKDRKLLLSVIGNIK